MITRFDARTKRRRGERKEFTLEAQRRKEKRIGIEFLNRLIVVFPLRLCAFA
jgi:cob(I)alamin adenosyltransferase